MGPDGFEDSLVLVVDRHELRSCGITNLVDEWVRPLGRRAVACTPCKLSHFQQRAENVSLILLSMGGASLFDEASQELSLNARESFPDALSAVISDLNSPVEAVEAAQLGHQGFMSTGTPQEIARHALAFLIYGGTYFPREALVQSRSGAAHTARPCPGGEHDGSLTPRQHEVLNGLKFGKSNKVIARDLHMQESTVKVHVRQIMRKLGAMNRTQVALIASTQVSSAARPAVG